MRKIQFGIAGFVTGIMLGLLLGLAEMRLLQQHINPAIIPFMIGITVIFCAITGVVIGMKKAR
ncbi:MAG: DUF5957 family protein [Ferruginibacter sp.]|nr:DUF5957 family protein [Ferruginibacter sp.]